jgi:hypothetical protein
MLAKIARVAENDHAHGAEIALVVENAHGP